ncbi:hypothetical protein GNI_007340 [Gregarina niphandrodes]|uniref:HEAT repeat-containing protein 1 n=1 Tax=Gregarina niphandrodes TaxID=110365 RepID=A0A023BD59_GRENI|nr:hypothetical protein GNI_007340 [Gregarina niphandrodes]EZG87278.1 hypothetical protein GNI_007340 [Gregarina niphandrodes]|eukprot:XP_011128674.1 hypothetical protein GNI_007340 [Gregarina niphandrodes]
MMYYGLFPLENLLHRKVLPLWIGFVLQIDVYQSTLETVREEKLNEIDSVTRDFIRVLGDRWVTLEGLQVLEYLCRAFFIQERLAFEMVALAIPFHNRPIFVRMCQVVACDINSYKTAWITSVQKSGLPVGMKSLVKLCSSCPALLYRLCSFAMDILEKNTICMNTSRYSQHSRTHRLFLQLFIQETVNNGPTKLFNDDRFIMDLVSIVSKLNALGSKDPALQYLATTVTKAICSRAKLNGLVMDKLLNEFLTLIEQQGFDSDLNRVSENFGAILSRQIIKFDDVKRKEPLPRSEFSRYVLFKEESEQMGLPFLSSTVTELMTPYISKIFSCAMRQLRRAHDSGTSTQEHFSTLIIILRSLMLTNAEADEESALDLSSLLKDGRGFIAELSLLRKRFVEQMMEETLVFTSCLMEAVPICHTPENILLAGLPPFLCDLFHIDEVAALSTILNACQAPALASFALQAIGNKGKLLVELGLHSIPIVDDRKAVRSTMLAETVIKAAGENGDAEVLDTLLTAASEGLETIKVGDLQRIVVAVGPKLSESHRLRMLRSVIGRCVGFADDLVSDMDTLVQANTSGHRLRDVLRTLVTDDSRSIMTLLATRNTPLDVAAKLLIGAKIKGKVATLESTDNACFWPLLAFGDEVVLKTFGAWILEQPGLPAVVDKFSGMAFALPVYHDIMTKLRVVAKYVEGHYEEKLLISPESGQQMTHSTLVAVGSQSQSASCVANVLKELLRRQAEQKNSHVINVVLNVLNMARNSSSGTIPPELMTLIQSVKVPSVSPFGVRGPFDLADDEARKSDETRKGEARVETSLDQLSLDQLSLDQLVSRQSRTCSEGVIVGDRVSAAAVEFYLSSADGALSLLYCLVLSLQHQAGSQLLTGSVGSAGSVEPVGLQVEPVGLQVEPVGLQVEEVMARCLSELTVLAIPVTEGTVVRVLAMYAEAAASVSALQGPAVARYLPRLLAFQKFLGNWLVAQDGDVCGDPRVMQAELDALHAHMCSEHTRVVAGGGVASGGELSGGQSLSVAPQIKEFVVSFCHVALGRPLLKQLVWGEEAAGEGTAGEGTAGEEAVAASPAGKGKKTKSQSNSKSNKSQSKSTRESRSLWTESNALYVEFAIAALVALGAEAATLRQSLAKRLLLQASRVVESAAFPRMSLIVSFLAAALQVPDVELVLVDRSQQPIPVVQFALEHVRASEDANVQQWLFLGYLAAQLPMASVRMLASAVVQRTTSSPDFLTHACASAVRQFGERLLGPVSTSSATWRTLVDLCVQKRGEQWALQALSAPSNEYRTRVRNEWHAGGGVDMSAMAEDEAALFASEEERLLSLEFAPNVAAISRIVAALASMTTDEKREQLVALVLRALLQQYINLINIEPESDLGIIDQRRFCQALVAAAKQTLGAIGSCLDTVTSILCEEVEELEEVRAEEERMEEGMEERLALQEEKQSWTDLGQRVLLDPAMGTVDRLKSVAEGRLATSAEAVVHESLSLCGVLGNIAVLKNAVRPGVSDDYLCLVVARFRPSLLLTRRSGRAAELTLWLQFVDRAMKRDFQDLPPFGFPLSVYEHARARADAKLYSAFITSWVSLLTSTMLEGVPDFVYPQSTVYNSQFRTLLSDKGEEYCQRILAEGKVIIHTSLSGAEDAAAEDAVAEDAVAEDAVAEDAVAEDAVALDTAAMDTLVFLTLLVVCSPFTSVLLSDWLPFLAQLPSRLPLSLPLALTSLALDGSLLLPYIEHITQHLRDHVLDALPHVRAQQLANSRRHSPWEVVLALICGVGPTLLEAGVPVPGEGGSVQSGSDQLLQAVLWCPQHLMTLQHAAGRSVSSVRGFWEGVQQTIGARQSEEFRKQLVRVRRQLGRRLVERFGARGGALITTGGEAAAGDADVLEVFAVAIAHLTSQGQLDVIVRGAATQLKRSLTQLQEGDEEGECETVNTLCSLAFVISRCKPDELAPFQDALTNLVALTCGFLGSVFESRLEQDVDSGDADARKGQRDGSDEDRKRKRRGRASLEAQVAEVYGGKLMEAHPTLFGNLRMPEETDLNDTLELATIKRVDERLAATDHQDVSALAAHTRLAQVEDAVCYLFSRLLLKLGPTAIGKAMATVLTAARCGADACLGSRLDGGETVTPKTLFIARLFCLIYSTAAKTGGALVIGGSIWQAEDDMLSILRRCNANVVECFKTGTSQGSSPKKKRRGTRQEIASKSLSQLTSQSTSRSWYWLEVGVPALMCLGDCCRALNESRELVSGMASQPFAVSTSLMDEFARAFDVFRHFDRFAATGSYIGVYPESEDVETAKAWLLHLRFAIIETLGVASQDTSVLGVAYDRLLEKLLDSEDPRVKLAVARVLHQAWATLGVALLPVLNDTLKLVVHMLDNADPEVNAFARAMTLTIERATGESLEGRLAF